MRSHTRMTAREKRVERLFEVPMLVLTALLVPVIGLPYVIDVSSRIQVALQLASLLIWAAFYIELFVKLAVARSYGAAILRNWFLIIILLSPLLLSFRLVRLARLVSLVRLLRMQAFLRRLGDAVRTIIYNVEYIALALFAFVVAAALLVWHVEANAGGSITSFPDALWWALITVTTIGYGDIVPSSGIGKIVGAFAAFFGILLFMILTARLTAIFVRYERTGR